MAERRACKLIALALLVTTGWLAGCRGGRGTSGIPPRVSLSPDWPQRLTEGQSLVITATIVNDSSNSGVHWSLSGAGSLSNETPHDVTYVAPVNVSSDQSALIMATSIASPNANATLQVTVLAHGRE